MNKLINWEEVRLRKTQ